MIRKLYTYFVPLFLGIAAASCSDSLNDIDTPLVPDSPGTVTISFRNSESTRSTASDNSEKLIDNLLVALYVDGTDETVAPKMVKSFSNLAASSSTTVTLQLTEDMVTGLFNDVDGAECRMFAVANLPADAVIPANPTIGQLKQIEISAPFDRQEEQASFVMAGEGKVKYTAPASTEARGKASGSGTLYRAAAKIRLNVYLPDKIEIKEGDNVVETWIPATTGIQVSLNNGVNKSIVAPLPDAEGNQWEPTDDSQYYGCNRTLSVSNGGAEDYPYTMDVPFYTFPNAWTENVNETGKTTMTLMVPWQRQGEPSWTTYYYQVPVVPSTLTHIDRNYSYNINLKVGMLGSLIPDTPVELPDLTYQVLNWGQEDIDVSIQDYRYLVVNPNVISVQNEGEIIVSFYSSHPVEVENISMSFKRFNFYADGNGTEVSIDVPQNKLEASVANDGTRMVSYEIVTDVATNQKSLKINHALEIWTPVNSAGTEVRLTGRNGTGQNTLEAVTNSIAKFERPTNPEAPYSAYTFNVKIQHGDNASYSEDITITQYPAMYIEAKRNPGGGADNKGNVWVNNANGTGGDYGGVFGISSNASNKNPNMYVISISQLNTSEFSIGDPRSNYINNTLEVNNNGSLVPTSNQETAATWDSNATALYLPGNNGRRHLTYYYPTDEVANTDIKSMMVAPKIRIASSFGVTNQISRNYARKRVAVYQEVNCPAGRWRLPTYGELLYIIRLSSSGKIPMLFNHYPNGENRERYCYYWTAQGLYRVNSDATLTKINDSNTGGVKGIYDEWYWENIKNYTISPDASGNYTYTLGDVPRGVN